MPLPFDPQHPCSKRRWLPQGVLGTPGLLRLRCQSTPPAIPAQRLLQQPLDLPTGGSWPSRPRVLVWQLFIEPPSSLALDGLVIFKPYPPPPLHTLTGSDRFLPPPPSWLLLSTKMTEIAERCVLVVYFQGLTQERTCGTPFPRRLVLTVWSFCCHFVARIKLGWGGV